jgi:hypothetical protein
VGAAAPAAVVLQLNTDTVPGALTITSASSYWGGSSCNGILLCKVLPADMDFSAQVQIIGGDLASWNGAMDYLCPGLLVRNPDVAAADFVDVFGFDRDNWTAVTLFESWDDDVETEIATADAVSVLDNPWVKLERTGDDFTVYFGPDGTSWTPVADPVTREDLAGMELQIGISHSMNTGNTGTTQYDNFTLECGACQVGILDVDPNSYLNVFYRPSMHSISASLSGGQNISSVQLIGLDGKMISKTTVNNSHVEIEAPGNGIYIVLVESNGSRLAKKVVVQ